MCQNPGTTIGEQIMSEGVAKLLSGLGYDANRLAEESGRIELTIESFDPWSRRPGMAITTTCGVAMSIRPDALR